MKRRIELFELSDIADLILQGYDALLHFYCLQGYWQAVNGMRRRRVLRLLILRILQLQHRSL
jgi:hypothetical protein